MSRIEILSEETIDKIAAGEVIERPASVVKELVENSIDAGADAITVEIKDGGISFIRITDNGSGIYKEDIPKAFLRHATSKLRSAEDLHTVTSLGFRGEALSSVAAVAQVELISKTGDSIIGTRYVIEGAKEKEIGEIGVPAGTTIIVRNIFFNTPVRKKFLKSGITEGSYVAEICEHLALSRPDISIKFVSNGQVKFHTSGSGDLKELIYRIYGKDIAGEVIPINYEGKTLSIKGYLGKPVLNRSTRNYENYFINGRFVKSKVIASAFEEGYKEYLMQHKFPFFTVNIEIDTKAVDVNVHPTKMDVRFEDGQEILDIISSAVAGTLKVREMIPESLLTEEKPEHEKIVEAPEPFEQSRKSMILPEDEAYSNAMANADADATKPISELKANSASEINITTESKESHIEQDEEEQSSIQRALAKAVYGNRDMSHLQGNVIKASEAVVVNTGVQMNMFEDRLLTKEAMADYRIVGQVFDTFWIIEYKDKLMVMDQHAAHEKVKYEKLMSKIRAKEILSQSLNPPIVLTLSPTEHTLIAEYRENFENAGFDIEDFGGMDISIRAIPLDLFGKEPKELFLEILDELSFGKIKGVPEVINEKIASMACKAAVKGNNSMSFKEVEVLLSELMELENPYNCPHGRPTIFTMSKYEMEKRFKRIV